MADPEHELKQALINRGARRLRRALARLAAGHLVDATSEAAKGAELLAAAWAVEAEANEIDEDEDA